jgi:hypothetical protein
VLEAVEGGLCLLEMLEVLEVVFVLVVAKVMSIMFLLSPINQENITYHVILA